VRKTHGSLGQAHDLVDVHCDDCGERLDIDG
jgi:hypothetical protein